ncbi:hypothetical protein C4585_02665 [Candidatus Parcubacteria bacterium]|nr:MAG: hypothetical protein C4585_02665 [Candidatus Parcubacteria bacterium]
MRMSRIITLFAAPFVLLLLFVPLAFAEAQLATPYYCGSYWSSTPCNYGVGGGYNYPYQNYPYNYYPYNTYPSYPYNYARPTCTITYSYGSYHKHGYANQAIVLSWYSYGATSASISPSVGSTATSGSTTVYPSGSTTYTLTVWGPGGASTCQTTYYQPANYYYQPYNYYQQYPYMYYPYQYNYNPYWGY